MRTTCYGLAIWLFCSIPPLTQTTAQVKGSAFKPSAKIAMTVTFTEKLPPGSTVQVIYRLQPGQQQYSCRRDDSLNWTGTSTDNLTFNLTFTVPENIVPGTYEFAELSVSNPDLQGKSVQKTMNAPIITVTNGPCPKVVEIPNFKITVP